MTRELNHLWSDALSTIPQNWYCEKILENLYRVIIFSSHKHQKQDNRQKWEIELHAWTKTYWVFYIPSCLALTPCRLWGKCRGVIIWVFMSCFVVAGISYFLFVNDQSLKCLSDGRWSNWIIDIHNVWNAVCSVNRNTTARKNYEFQMTSKFEII